MVSPQVFDLASQHGPVVPQVIPGYTGHFTGFRETVGKTYGHAELMLGRVSPAFVPLYRKEDIRGDEMGICRSGYPTFVKPTDRWSRRPPTAMKPLVKDPISREARLDIVKHLSNILIERVPGESRVPRVRGRISRCFRRSRSPTPASCVPRVDTGSPVCCFWLH
jgi:hypothetical protein